MRKARRAGEAISEDDAREQAGQRPEFLFVGKARETMLEVRECIEKGWFDKANEAWAKGMSADKASAWDKGEAEKAEAFMRRLIGEKARTFVQARSRGEIKSFIDIIRYFDSFVEEGDIPTEKSPKLEKALMQFVFRTMDHDSYNGRSVAKTHKKFEPFDRLGLFTIEDITSHTLYPKIRDRKLVDYWNSYRAYVQGLHTQVSRSPQPVSS